ncbi:hypothetical protein D3C81_746310 [compost metagenome]
MEQRALGRFDSAPLDVLDRRHLHDAFKSALQMVRTAVAHVGQKFQRKLLVIMAVDVVGDLPHPFPVRQRLSVGFAALARAETGGLGLLGTGEYPDVFQFGRLRFA